MSVAVKAQSRRYAVLEALDGILPLPMVDCTMCDPSGGCPNPMDCRLQLAEEVLAVIERETGITI
jgi:hypothetical protein